jgi:hypothetical protein
VVNIKGDSTVESDETMTVTLSNAPANSNIVTAAASTVLTNDDASLTITPCSPTRTKATPPTWTHLHRHPLGQCVPDLHELGGGCGIANAVNGTDFYSSQPAGVFKDGNGIPYGTLSFASGETSKTITLRIAGDSTLEVDETLRVNLSNPSSGTEIQGGTADGYVRNDDAEFNITAGTASVVEGDNGFTGTALTYTVTRTGYLSQTNTVNWASDTPPPTSATSPTASPTSPQRHADLQLRRHHPDHHRLCLRRHRRGQHREQRDLQHQPERCQRRQLHRRHRQLHQHHPERRHPDHRLHRRHARRRDGGGPVDHLHGHLHPLRRPQQGLVPELGGAEHQRL